MYSVHVYSLLDVVIKMSIGQPILYRYSNIVIGLESDDVKNGQGVLS